MIHADTLEKHKKVIASEDEFPAGWDDSENWMPLKVFCERHFISYETMRGKFRSNRSGLIQDIHWAKAPGERGILTINKVMYTTWLKGFRIKLIGRG